MYDDDLKAQMEVLSPFCVMEERLPTVSDCKNAINFFDLKEKIIYHHLIDEILTLNNQLEDIKSWPKYIEASSSAQR